MEEQAIKLYIQYDLSYIKKHKWVNVIINIYTFMENKWISVISRLEKVLCTILFFFPQMFYSEDLLI